MLRGGEVLGNIVTQHATFPFQFLLISSAKLIGSSHLSSTLYYGKSNVVGWLLSALPPL